MAAAADSYEPRRTDFTLDPQLCDEKVIRRDHTVSTHYEAQLRSRKVIHHRDLGHLSLISNLSRIQFGYWHNDPACLVALHFQFLGSSPHWRFEKSDIELRFSPSSSSSSSSSPKPTSDTPPADAITVADYGPKHVAASLGSTQKTERHFTLSLSASLAATVPPATVTASAPGVQYGVSRTCERHHATSVSSAAYPTRGAREPNAVRWYLREDEAAHTGIPLEFDCAVVVRADRQFSAAVDVKTGPVFDLLARPWSGQDELVITPGVEYGTEGLELKPNPDFEKMGREEWRAIVRPDAEMSGGDEYAGA